MIPKVMVKNLVTETHELFGHFGTAKVYNVLKKNYQIHQMYKTIKEILKRCDICQRSKIVSKNLRGPLIANIPNQPREKVSLDLMGPLPRGQLGNQYILVLMDIFSKHVQLYPLRRATVENILRKIKQFYLPKHGSIQNILTDNGTQFHSKKWKDQLKQWDIHHMVTTTYHPESNPVERTNREIGRILRTYCYNKHTNWVQYLSKIEYWINNVTNTSTGYTPQEIVDGRQHKLTLETIIQYPETQINPEDTSIWQIVYKNLKRKAQYRCDYHNRNKTFPKYQVGQQILVKEHKLSSATEKEIRKFFLIYRGPYVIQQVRENNTVLIADDKGHQTTQNFKNIKLYFPPDPGLDNPRISET